MPKRHGARGSEGPPGCLALARFVGRDGLAPGAGHELVENQLVDRLVDRADAAVAVHEVDLAGMLAHPVRVVVERPGRHRLIDGAIDIGPDTATRRQGPVARNESRRSEPCWSSHPGYRRYSRSSSDRSRHYRTDSNRDWSDLAWGSSCLRHREDHSARHVAPVVRWSDSLGRAGLGRRLGATVRKGRTNTSRVRRTAVVLDISRRQKKFDSLKRLVCSSLPKRLGSNPHM